MQSLGAILTETYNLLHGSDDTTKPAADPETPAAAPAAADSTAPTDQPAADKPAADKPAADKPAAGQHWPTGGTRQAVGAHGRPTASSPRGGSALLAADFRRGGLMDARAILYRD